MISLVNCWLLGQEFRALQQSYFFNYLPSIRLNSVLQVHIDFKMGFCALGIVASGYHLVSYRNIIIAMQLDRRGEVKSRERKMLTRLKLHVACYTLHVAVALQF